MTWGAGLLLLLCVVGIGACIAGIFDELGADDE